MITKFVDYFNKAKKMQELLYQGFNWTKEDIDDDLVFNVPIYDIINRRYAVFSSMPEAILRPSEDAKDNYKFFPENDMPLFEKLMLLYLFRLCGSGINYKPINKGENPLGSHGWGNFWINGLMYEGIFDCDQWMDNIPENKFSDNKGYLLPMIPKGLRNFIVDDSRYIVRNILKFIDNHKGCSVVDVVDYANNNLLITNGYKRQNFVMTAFAMDIAEYFPEYVNPDGDVYVGSNAKKCLKQIFPDIKGIGSNLRVTNDALQLLIDITGGHNKKMDMEDVACDFIRYINNFQSEDHIRFNNGIKYYNNVCE